MPVYGEDSKTRGCVSDCQYTIDECFYLLVEARQLGLYQLSLYSCVPFFLRIFTSFNNSASEGCTLLFRGWYRNQYCGKWELFCVRSAS